MRRPFGRNAGFWAENKAIVGVAVVLVIVVLMVFPPTKLFNSKPVEKEPEEKEKVETGPNLPVQRIGESYEELQRKHNNLVAKYVLLQSDYSACEEKLAKAKFKQNAYVYFLPDPEENNVWTSLVSVYSLIKSNPSPEIDIIVAVPASTQRPVIDIIKGISARVMVVEWLPITPPDTDKCYAPFRIQFTKLNAWNLDKYQRVVLVDPDVLFLRNVDELFSLPPDSAPNLEVAAFNLNGGLYVLKTNTSRFISMVNQLATGSLVYDDTNCEIGFLSEIFKDRFFPISYMYNLFGIPTADFWPKSEINYAIPRDTHDPLNPDLVAVYHFATELPGVKPWFRPSPTCPTNPRAETTDLYFLKKWWDLRSEMMARFPWLNKVTNENLIEARWNPKYGYEEE